MKTFKKILKDELKAKGLEHISKKIVSIKTDRNAARVKTINLFKKEREILENILGEYTEGNFDGMQDMYVYNSKKTNKEISFMYVFLNNEFSSDIVEKAKNNLKDNWDIIDDKTCQEKRFCWYDVALLRDLNELEA